MSDLDLSHVRRRTVAERDYWIDQLLAEVQRLRAQRDEALRYMNENGEDPAGNIEAILRGDLKWYEIDNYVSQQAAQSRPEAL